MNPASYLRLAREWKDAACDGAPMTDLSGWRVLIEVEGGYVAFVDAEADYGLTRRALAVTLRALDQVDGGRLGRACVIADCTSALPLLPDDPAGPVRMVLAVWSDGATTEARWARYGWGDQGEPVWYDEGTDTTPAGAMADLARFAATFGMVTE